MKALWDDLYYGLRGLRRNLGFALTSVISVALGIGANTAIFTVVNGVLFEPLPHRDPHRIVRIHESNPSAGLPTFSASPPNFNDFRRMNRVFEFMTAYSTGVFNLTYDGEAKRLQGLLVNSQYFLALGNEAALGRVFNSDDDQPGAEPVVVLNHGFWQRRFGGDPSILGRTLSLNGKSTAVIGVLPSDFPQDFDVFMPLIVDYSDEATRGKHNLRMLARLKDGISVADAQEDLEAIAAILEQEYPETNTGWTVLVQSLMDRKVGEFRPALLALQIAVALVLLIVWANVANLLQVRATQREREVSLRMALGAGRWQLIRLFLAESLLLAFGGSALGLLLAFQGARLLVHYGADQIPRLETLSIGGEVLWLPLILSLLSWSVFGAMSMAYASRSKLQASLKGGGRGQVSSVGGQRVRQALILIQVAMALPLLVCAGLLIKNYGRLIKVDPGFDSQNVLTARLDLPEAEYSDEIKQVHFYERMYETLEQLPGVEAFGAVIPMPLGGGNSKRTFIIHGRPTLEGKQSPIANVRLASSGYFETMRIPIRRGRGFRAEDRIEAPRVAVINRSAARRFWPDQDPLDSRIAFGVGGKGLPPEWVTIVGVVGDVRHQSLSVDTDVEIYLPFLQRPTQSTTLVLRTVGRPTDLVGTLRENMRTLAPDIPIHDIKTLRQIVTESFTDDRFNTYLLSVFAAVAFVLASIGVYGVISFSMSQRLKEIGVRLALGAGRRQVLSLLVRQGMLPVVLGLAIGLLGSYLATRLIDKLIYGVSPTDIMTFATATAALYGAALLACLLPALRAVQADPVAALHDE